MYSTKTIEKILIASTMDEYYDTADLDIVDTVLKKYVLNPFDLWQVSNIFDEALEKYPNAKPLTVYRGLNFKTEQQYNEFISNIKNDKIEFDDVSSWTPFIKEAEKFARTTPGYNDSVYFDYEYALQVKQEGVSGFCGIIMSTNIPAYSAIDLRGTGLATESELILPKGVYQIKIEDIIRPLSEMLKTTTLDEIIQKHIKINGQSDFFSDLLKSKVFSEYSPSDVSTKTREYIWEIYGEQYKTFADKVKYETDGYFQQITFQIEPISYYPFNVFVFFPENIKKQIIKKVAPFVKKSIDKLVELRKEHEFEKGKRNLLINFDIDTEFFEIIPNAEEYINRVHNNGYVGKIIKELTSRENNKKIKSEKDLTKRMKQIQRLYETII